MRPVNFLPVIFLASGLILLPLCSQTHKAPAAAPPAISDAEVQQLVQAVSAHDWEKNDWDKIVHPAIKKIAALDKASRQKLIQPLEDLLDNEDINHNAEQALSAVGTPALASLLAIAQKSEGPRQRMAVGAIGNIKPKPVSAIPVLLTLGKTTDPKLREYLVSTLGSIGPASPTAPTTTPTVNLLIAALKDHVAGAESALGSYGAPALPELRKILNTSTDTEQRIAAIEALAAMREPAAPATPELMDAIKVKETRVKAIWAINKIGLPAKQAIPVLKLVVAKDPDYWDPPKQYSNFTADDNERKYAIQALNQMKLEDEYFVQCAKDSVPGARDVLISKGAAIVPRMKALLNDNDKDTKQMALWVLMQVGPASAPAVPELIECVGTQEYRVPALLALSTIGPAAAPAIPTLIHTLLDEENRTTAIDALGNIGPAAKDAVPFLIDILQGKEQFTIKPPPPGYTYAYGEKLGNIGRMGMTVMQEFAAEGALKKIGTPEALQAVKDYEANKPK